KPCDCNVQDTKNMVAAQKTGRFGFDFGAFSLGLTRGLIVCPPLIALLIYSLPFANPLGSVGIAVLFGLGTALSPILLLGGVTGWLLNKAPLFRKWISIAGGTVLIMLGIFSMVSSLIQLT
ncbi:MAG: sulfite exporter TauE/SafE family protein, partial [Chloroflexi bacterium]|nr:sulfite exporter TauE/SafE family protein [Chloroflexota bacterium]